ncbi:lipocalin family protein [Chryseobacterium sp. S0630]|uniref:lipocalin family protein n=1 Tax=Chryseobacterium sp. S0630 TaxID=2957803 RepID=UPI0020A0A6EC|nr:lipocalin family protein [Chryseobacterium sp. S0630]MCP1299612.1 lipocalin family protein [Chryseobacterium sp. S0630]
MKKKVLSLIILGILTACTSPKKENTEVSSNKTSDVKAKLVGKWVQPIPGQEKEKEGIELRENGTAASINIHTLLYEQWKVSHDTLFLWSRTVGVAQPSTSSDIDTLLIQKLDNTSLTVVSLIGDPKNNVAQTYSKEK